MNIIRHSLSALPAAVAHSCRSAKTLRFPVSNHFVKYKHIIVASILAATLLSATCAADVPGSAWEMGAPIVSYWAGPGFPNGGDLTDAAATQMGEGGWNLVWCEEKELDVVQRHGLRGLLTSDLLNPAALDDPAKREALDAFILRVRQHPGFYAYHLSDEPGVAHFPALARLVAYLREHDPAHLAYINLFPIYASNEQLGTKGTATDAYSEYLRQYVEDVRPSLLSYDHYHFTNAGDEAQYFLNLALARKRAMSAGIPFLNIVQASAWGLTPLASPTGPRVPNGDEVRFLVYTTLAYGAQGISYYVYSFPGHLGNITEADGTPKPLYHVLKSLNPEFVAIAKELRPLKSLNVFHTGMQPPGAEPLPKQATFTFDPPVADMDYKPRERVQGVLLGEFGSSDKADTGGTHVLVVNLDYKVERIVGVRGPAPLEVFDAAIGKWLPAGGSRAELRLTKGGGKLVRVRP